MPLIRKILLVFLLICLAETTSQRLCRAHKVTIFAYVEGGKVYTESYYSDGTRCRQSQIEVFAASGKRLLLGRTNNEGEFSFTPSSPGPVKLVLHAGMGHRAETTISAQALKEGGAGSRESQEISAAPSGALTVGQLQTILDKSLDRKLHPLMKLMVERQKRGVSARDVFAGLGYIFGLMGLVIYFRGSKRGRKTE